MTKRKSIGADFFLRDDVVTIGQECLGKYLFTSIDGVVTGGYIVETEAYRGPEDRACHAYNNRRTKRTEPMFQNGGICYVYLCYGIHHLLNFVTNVNDIPHAVLIRGLKPTHGIETMLKRQTFNGIIQGPGSVAKALGIDLSFNNEPLNGDKIWLEDREMEVDEIKATTRVGIDYAGIDAFLPWRFILNETS